MKLMVNDKQIELKALLFPQVKCKKGVCHVELTFTYDGVLREYDEQKIGDYLLSQLNETIFDIGW